MNDPETLHNILGYPARARQMLKTSRLTPEHQDYITAVNRRLGYFLRGQCIVGDKTHGAQQIFWRDCRLS
jgi:hypothetical protein